MRKMFPCILAGTLLLPFRGIASDTRPTRDDLVQRHRQSIGTDEARSEIKARVIGGPIHFSEAITHSVDYAGSVSAMQDDHTFKQSMHVESPFYNGEEFTVDAAGAVKVRETAPGQHSMLGDFIYRNPVLLTEGLWGGVLNLSWPLLRNKDAGDGLKLKGTKVFNAIRVFDVEYEPRHPTTDGDLKVHLYFSCETFQHIGTLYRYTVVDRGTSKNFRLEERFGLFETSGGLTLPLRWEIHWQQEEANSPREYVWRLDLNSLQSGAGFR